jgi:GNAT superfamily N-acetyltransferase
MTERGERDRRDGQPGDAVLRAMDRSVVALLRYFGLSSPGAVVEEDGDLVMVAGAVAYPGPMHNAVFRANPSASPAATIDRALDFFRHRHRRFVLWASEHADDDLKRIAIDRGFTVRGGGGRGSAAMYTDEPLAQQALPEGVRLEPVTDAGRSGAFVRVVAGAFAGRADPQPEVATTSLFGQPALLLAPQVSALLARVGKDDAGAAMTYLDGGVANLCWVGTLPRFRGRGIAAALTTACVNAAFSERGAGLAVLQSSTMGEPLYARLGFREATRYARLLSPDPVAPSS